MRVLHAFNLANDGFNVVRGLRKIGVDAELLIQKPSHVASLPQWEDGEVDMFQLGNPYDPNWNAFTWNMPDWVHVWNANKSWYPFSRTLRWLRIFGKLKGYDLIVGHVPFAKVSTLYQTLYGKPYIVYDAGWIRYLKNNARGYARARKGYAQAAMILFTNVDTEQMFHEHGYHNLYYTPFAIDTDKYTPRPNHIDHDYPVFFHPSRHDWAEKGNDLLIRAFARYVKRNPRALLRMVEWYQSPEDLWASKRLIQDLEIANKCEWISVQPKSRLVNLYRDSTAIFDQFVFGAFGTTCPEGLSCGVPVVGYAKPNLWLQYHETMPPVLNASTENDIYEAMLSLEDEATRKRFGQEGRQWVMENCSDVVVAKQQLALYKQVVESN
ncbi:MAG: hypothetical protein UT24_C0003G0085 [Candidatus Woesebacteria bacterium GW2011_GWB1_39_12]|uniref:Glycosyl transferase family 1 domain-containing protein n=1 Tax=Candidatus Woesebacteria bacterium GW2011_GWB1_39_12 TaxID=1618574 RepID=A0A0G0MES2_9BACT|nr:MAG: hypothetical protein UT24_C0003G0085 [Candidatus Woesebacteria bacterium GW2011_GWB1_39_12]